MRKIINSIFYLPFAPIFFSVSFVLVLFAHNIGELTIPRIIFPLIIAVILSVFFYFISTSILKNREKGLVYSSLFSILFFSYGELTSFTRDFRMVFGNIILDPKWLTLLSVIGLQVLIFISVARTSRNLLKLKKYLSVIALIAFIIPLQRIGAYETVRVLQKTPENPLISAKINLSGISRDKLPDIYYIIPDSYAGGETLGKYFNYDNRPFISFLENKGFYIASQSSSNYPKTFLSIASSLNMQYLDFMSGYKNSTDQTLTDRMIENNNIVKFLKTAGYHYYQMGSWWGPTHFNRIADENFIIEKNNLGDIGEFNYMIMNSSMLSPLVSAIFPGHITGESEDDKRARVNYQFETLEQVSKLPGPKFVFIHIVSPHGPYVFGKNCEEIHFWQTVNESEEKNYSNQLNCLNQKLETAVGGILADAPHLPVILIQADEGPNFLNAKLVPPDGWKNAGANILKEKFPIFSAYFLPGMPKSYLYPSITPVNSFRMIFNLYFAAKLPLLPDRNFVFTDSNHLYEFIEVTDKLK